MTFETTIQYGPSAVSFWKSPNLIALAAKPGQSQPLESELVSAGATPFILEGFFIVDIKTIVPDLETGLDMLRASPHVHVGTHVYSTGSDRVPFVPNGEIFLRVTPDADLNTVGLLISELKLQIFGARGSRDFLVRVTSGSPNPMKVAAQLQASELVEVAEPELVTEGALHGLVFPADNLLAMQWHLRNTGHHHGTTLGFREGADARVIDAWQEFETLGSNEVVVAVIDDAFDITHPDLNLGRIVSPWDFKRNNSLPSPDLVNITPNEWHGTACAGVAIGAAEGHGITGVAPLCRFMPIRWGSSLKDDQIERWFEYVSASGADVVSCSWSSKARNYPLSTRKFDAIRKCAQSGRGGLGCVVCFAADNYARDIYNPAEESVNGFATHPDVITVSASTSLDQRSDYSSFGDAVTVCAPSSGAGGWAITTSDVSGTYTLDGVVREAGYADGPFTHDFGGTSSACPLVAGVCALVLSTNSTLTSAQVKLIIGESARKIGDANDYDENGHSKYFGYGCVNALEALRRASNF